MADAFDTPDNDAEVIETRKEDPSRPEAKRGRYYLPNPVSGKTRSFQRVTNFIKLAEDTYHLELWKMRNVARGIGLMATERDDLLAQLSASDVRTDKDWLNAVCEKAQNASDAYAMATRGTELHHSTELADYAGGDLSVVPEADRAHVALYLKALRDNGLTVAPDMIERVTASSRYDVAGKFDRVYRLADGSYVAGDLKTSDSLDLSFPSIAGQLACYEDGINNTGVFTGKTGPGCWDTSIKVRSDFGIVVHLPSTRREATVYRVSLDQGHARNAVCLSVRDIRRTKAKHVADVFEAAVHAPVTLSQDEVDARWLERANAAHTVSELLGLVAQARDAGQYNERLAGQFRLLAAELKKSAEQGLTR